MPKLPTVPGEGEMLLVAAGYKLADANRMCAHRHAHNCYTNWQFHFAHLVWPGGELFVPRPVVRSRTPLTSRYR
jgi:hypothetical protein